MHQDKFRTTGAGEWVRSSQLIEKIYKKIQENVQLQQELNPLLQKYSNQNFIIKLQYQNIIEKYNL